MPGPAAETPKSPCGKTLTDFTPELQDAQTPETRKAQSCMALAGSDLEPEAKAMPEGEVESPAEPASTKPVGVNVVTNGKNEKDALYWKLPS